MTVGYVAGSSGLQHDSATRRLDEAQGRQRRLAESLEPWADGEWASTHTLMAVAQHPDALVALVYEPRDDE
jgi:hypothetical protein